MTLRDHEPRCHWNPDTGWLTPEHVRDCTAGDCGGCKPCPATHCAMRGTCANHVDDNAGIRTCPSCIGATRRKLGGISDLYAVAGTLVAERTPDVGALLDEAAESGIDSEALNMVGPAASHEQWSEKRRRLAAEFDARGWCTFPRPEALAEDDPHHPYAVLSRWDITLRDQYGPQTDLFVTVTSAVDYLTKLLAGPFAHSDEFEDFSRDIAKCHNHLETVIHDSRTPEVGRPCPTCGEGDTKAPRLQKRYAAHTKVKPGEQCDLHDCRTCAGRDDTWHCPRVPEHWWSEDDYRLRVASDYLKHAAELPIIDLADRCGVPASTIRRWASTTKRMADGEWIETPPKLRPARQRTDGRKLYRVADVLRLCEGDKATAS